MTRSPWLAVWLLLGAATLPAQGSASASRWSAWLGCWQPVNAQSSVITCLVPTGDQKGVQRLTLAGDSITSRATIIADGKPRPAQREGCKGEENAGWSKTGTRVYLNGHFTCLGGYEVESSRLFAIVPGGDWLEEEQLRAGGVITRETRYREVAVPAAAPRAIARALEGRSMAIAAARASASAPPTNADVADAASFVDSTLVRGWLDQSGARLGGTTVFSQASGSYSYPAGAYGSGAYVGPSYPAYSAPSEPAPQQPIVIDPYVQGYAYPYAYGYPYAYPYGYGYYPYGLWSAPEIVVPGRARPREPHFWGLGTQPKPAAPQPQPRGHPGIRR